MTLGDLKNMIDHRIATYGEDTALVYCPDDYTLTNTRINFYFLPTEILEDQGFDPKVGALEISLHTEYE